MSAAFVGDWLVVCGGGAGLLALIAWAVDRRLGARWPRLVAGLWWLVLVRLLVPPHLASPLGWSVERAPGGGDPLLAASGPSAAASTEQVAGASDPVTILMWLWLAGAALAALGLARRLQRETDHWSAVEGRAPRAATRAVLERAARSLGLRRVPRVLVTGDRGGSGPRDAGEGPATIGLVRPWIALPHAYEGRARELEGVLLHELAHIARRDAWRRLVATACVATFWFHPAAWIASKRLAALAEFDCDRRAAASGDARDYRRALLGEVARRAGLAPEGGLVSGFGHPRSVALARLRALEDAALGAAPRAITARLEAALGSAVFALSLACLAPRVVEPPPAPIENPFSILEGLPPIPVVELPGCLNKRYAVMAHAAAQESATPDALDASRSTGSPAPSTFE